MSPLTSESQSEQGFPHKSGKIAKNRLFLWQYASEPIIALNFDFLTDRLCVRQLLIDLTRAVDQGSGPGSSAQTLY